MERTPLNDDGQKWRASYFYNKLLRCQMTFFTGMVTYCLATQTGIVGVILGVLMFLFGLLFGLTYI